MLVSSLPLFLFLSLSLAVASAPSVLFVGFCGVTDSSRCSFLSARVAVYVALCSVVGVRGGF